MKCTQTVSSERCVSAHACVSDFEVKVKAYKWLVSTAGRTSAGINDDELGSRQREASTRRHDWAYRHTPFAIIKAAAPPALSTRELLLIPESQVKHELKCRANETTAQYTKETHHPGIKTRSASVAPLIQE
jgi:hypothetical protein